MVMCLGNAIGTGPFMTEALLRSEASVDFLLCLNWILLALKYDNTKTRPTIPTKTIYIPSYRLYFVLLIIIVCSFELLGRMDMGRICSGWLAEH